MKSLDEKLHDVGVRQVNDRLTQTGLYDIVLKNPKYHIKDIDGELDIIAIRGDVMHYYEIKLRHSKKRKHHAIEQYHRVCKAFPNMKIKGIYIPLNGGKIKRMI